MLTKGDLVKVKQDTFMYPATLEPWYITKLKTPQYGVVIKQESETETKVFVNEQAWIINNKCLQLVGDYNVHKVKQNK